MTRPLTSRALVPLLLAVTAMAACEPASDAGSMTDPADLVLTDGRVVTVDQQLPEAEAVAMRDGRIVAVGTSDEIAAWVGDATEVIDLEGRLAIPGFIEGHGHYMSLGRSKEILDLMDVTSWEEIVSMVEEAVAAAEPGQWIEGRGWHQEKWTSIPEGSVDGVPVHDALSAVSPENPVRLGHASGHAAFVNAAVLEAAGITAATENPSGGEIVKDADGNPTGMLRETAQGLAGRARQVYPNEPTTPEEREANFRRQVRLAAEDALAHGVTAFQDAGSGFGTTARSRTTAAAVTGPASGPRPTSSTPAILRYPLSRAACSSLASGSVVMPLDCDGADRFARKKSASAVIQKIGQPILDEGPVRRCPTVGLRRQFGGCRDLARRQVATVFGKGRQVCGSWWHCTNSRYVCSATVVNAKY